MLRPPPSSTLFPYTTLFRSVTVRARQEFQGAPQRAAKAETVEDRLRYALASPFAKAYRRRRSEEHTSELQSRLHLVCRLLLEKKNPQILKSEEREAER